MADLNEKLSWGLVQLGYNVPANYACANQATHVDIIETWKHSDSVPNEQAILEAYDVWVIEQEKIKYTHGQNSSDRNNYISDFAKMTECDYIISSPSTFCICAGFVGRQKKIIHSKKWLENRIKVNDKFWVDLYNGGNEDYSIWRLV